MEKQGRTALSSERHAALLWLATVIGALPKRLRYRFFAHFHPELRAFFAQEPPPQVGDAKRIACPVHGTLQFASADAHLTVQVTLVIAGVNGEEWTVPLTVRWSAGRQRAVVRVEGDERLVDHLVAVVKGLSVTEQALLWTLLDDALADYEDHLLATHPELVREHEEALAEIERGEFVVYGGKESG